MNDDDRPRWCCATSTFRFFATEIYLSDGSPEEMLFVLVLLRAALASAVGENCAWCEGGNDSCNSSYASMSMDLFRTSITDAVGGRRFPLWRPAYQAPFGSSPSAATLAILVHHGALRNGDAYASHVVNAVLATGRDPASVLVFAPQIFEAGDAGLDEATMLWWGASADDGVEPDRGERDWHWGGNSTADLAASMSSFQVLDEVVAALEAAYPALERVVVAGHSAGGQITMRYALFSRLEAPRLRLEYFVANPSSVTYLNASRPTLPPQTCGSCVNATIAKTTYAFAALPPDGRCADYDAYGYGLSGPLPDYPAATGRRRALENYGKRAVFYVSGAADVCDAKLMKRERCVACEPDDGGLDTSCEAYAQGWCRMERLHAFAQFVRLFYDDDDAHSLVSVPNVGHSGCGIFQSPEFARAARLVPH